MEEFFYHVEVRARLVIVNMRIQFDEPLILTLLALAARSGE